jgi:very-short-patch-repair endonuclease
MSTDSVDDPTLFEPPRRLRRYSPGVHQHLSELRREMTPAERALWSWLRDRKLAGIKFRRQHPIGSFVLDFYAPSIRLVVEVDGDVHDLPEMRRYDARRQAWLAEQGMHVLRFTNGEVIDELSDVLEQIATVAEELRSGTA